MRRSKLFFSSILATVLGMGVIGGVVATRNTSNVQKVEAASHSASTRIWFDTGGSSTGGWAYDNAALHAWMIGYNKYHKLKWDSTVNKYYISTEKAATGFVLCRAPGNINVDNQTSWTDSACSWNKSGDVTFGTTSQNMININITAGTTPSSWSEFKIQNSGATIYVNTGSETSGWAADGAKISAWCWKTNGSQWANATWDSSIGFYKFTLPGNCSGFTLYRGSEYRTGTTWGNAGTQYNTSDLILDSKKTLLNGANSVPGSLSWGFYCDTYFYYVNDNSSATGNYVYTWGSSQYFGAWPGQLITSVGGVVTVEGDIKFNGSTAKKIYKIPYSTYAADTGIKFRGGSDDYQTADFTLTAGNAYQWDTTSQGDSVYTAMGDAIDLMLEEEELRKAATSQSICNISVSNCNSLYKKYAALSATAKGYVNNSRTKTYPSSSTSDTKVDVLFSKIFYQIGLRGGNITRSSLLNLSIFKDISNDAPASLTIIIITAATALSVCGYFFIRRKKQK